MKKYLAEFIGTFGLVLIGTGSIIFHDLVYPIGNLGIAISFGGAVYLMIILFGKVSGAHINPAVSLAFTVTPNLQQRKIIPYLTVQILGAILASLFLKLLFPGHLTLGTTLPIADWQSTFVLEFLLTFALMFIILLFSQINLLKKHIALAAGATVGLEAYFAGPYTGASMNPARSIGPALVSGNMQYLWVYIVSTCMGALLAGILWRTVKK